MARKPLPIGSWGLIRTYPVGQGEKGRPKRHKAVADYRDFDGVVRRVEASGRSVTQATPEPPTEAAEPQCRRSKR